MSSPGAASSLQEFYTAESETIRQAFEADGDGRRSARSRSILVDAIVAELCRKHISCDLAGPENLCLVALGGYGRSELFPHSDVDLLFLSENVRGLEEWREAVAAVGRALWDLHLQLGSGSRVLGECGAFDRDNLEFSISLLDCRYLAGDMQLFRRLHDQVIPHLMARDGPDLVRDLVEVTERRHQKYGDTIFHLEPNLKEAPGGLRDFQVARWLTRIFELREHDGWADPERLWPGKLAADVGPAFEFLAAARSFIHHRQGRDDNQLTYDLQEQSAAVGIGTQFGRRLSAADWMRTYFRHARAIRRLCDRQLDEAAPPRASLFGLFQDRRSRLSGPDFAVVRERIYPRQPGFIHEQPPLVLNLFEFAARHGLEPSHEAERWVEESLPGIAERLMSHPDLWPIFRRILVAPYAAQALRAMHRAGVLRALFPEFAAIDSLVVRDYYHRYTVDEHSLRAIGCLHALRRDPGKAQGGRVESGLEQWDEKFSEILGELEHPELLFLALLFHDVGKGLDSEDHIRGSLQALEQVFRRLPLGPDERETVRFLVAQHLAMSATLLRRDIFDPETVRSFAKQIGTTERLKLLCLLTYADVRSVNPDALTPWKAEMLWQLYAATWNELTRSVDRDRIQPAAEAADPIARILALLPAAPIRGKLERFLEGFPTRYLLTHTPEEVARHFQMAERLTDNPVQVSLGRRDDSHQLTAITADRPFLFASLVGTLAAWGMNILKADAFSNAAGIVLDTFRFADLHRTLELNPSELERLEQSVVDVLSGRTSLPSLLKGRADSRTLLHVKVRIPTQIRFEDRQGESGTSRTTLMELVAQDRAGLLYEISTALAELGVNINVALIDTEGQKVIDVFYITLAGKPLSARDREALREALFARLGHPPS